MTIHAPIPPQEQARILVMLGCFEQLTVRDLCRSLRLSRPAPILLPYDPATRRVLRGLWTGCDVNQVRADFEHARWQVRPVHLYPWWRCWRETPAWRLEAPK